MGHKDCSASNFTGELTVGLSPRRRSRQNTGLQRPAQTAQPRAPECPQHGATPLLHLPAHAHLQCTFSPGSRAGPSIRPRGLAHIQASSAQNRWPRTGLRQSKDPRRRQPEKHKMQEVRLETAKPQHKDTRTQVRSRGNARADVGVPG